MECSFCSLKDCNLGPCKLHKISDEDLKEILKKASEGKKQKVGNNLKAQNDRILRHVFNLGHGFEKSNDRRFTFNNLALDKLRKENDRTSNLGKITQSLNKPSIYFLFSAKLFTMGNGNQLFDYMAASELLLKRSYPEIADGT